MKKVKRVLALAVAVVMTAVMAISPVTAVSASAAPSKYVKSLKVSKSKVTLEVGKKATVNATVKVKGSASKKVTVKLTKANKKVVKSVKVGKPNKKGVSKLTITAANVSKKSTTTIKVVTKAKNSKKKVITKTIKVTVNPKAATPAPQPQPQPQPQPTPSQVNVTKVTLDKAAYTVEKGKAVQVIAAVEPANATNKEIKYNVADASVATVTDAGVVLGLKAGTTTLTAAATTGTPATATITVVEPVVVTLNKTELEIGLNQTANLTASVADVTWRSDNEDVAVVDQTGKVTGRAPGVANIIATSGAVAASCKVTVTKYDPENDGVTLSVFNPIKNNDGTVLENTCLVNQDMIIQAYVQKDTAPVKGARVKLQLDDIDYNGLYYRNFVIKVNGADTDVAVTNEEGIAEFTVTYDYDIESTYTDLDEAPYASFDVSTLVDNQPNDENITVKFASVLRSGIVIDNNRDITLQNIVPFKGAVDDGIENTVNTNGYYGIEYVSSQQVGENDEVYMSATPYFVLPPNRVATEDKFEVLFPSKEVTTGQTDVIVNGPTATQSYSIYNEATDMTTTTEIVNIPAGLVSMSVYFNKISVSKYSELYIDLYNWDGTRGSKVWSKKYTDVEKAYSKEEGVPVENLEDMTGKGILIVSLRSPGQVDVSKTGYSLNKVVGDYNTSMKGDPEMVEVVNSVKWADVTASARYSVAEEMTYAQVATYLSEYIGQENTYLIDDENYKFEKRLPVFNSKAENANAITGNALITSTYTAPDGTKKTATFAYPVVHKVEEGRFLNVNELVTKTDDVKAIFLGSDVIDANGDVQQETGGITQKGNQAVISSSSNNKSGVIFVEARLQIDALNKEIEAAEKIVDFDRHPIKGANKKFPLYSYVQFVASPEEEEADGMAQTYHAIEDQFVVITGEVKADNGEVQPDEVVEFYWNDTKITDVATKIGDDSSVQVKYVDAKTNKDGKAFLVLTGDYAAMANGIEVKYDGKFKTFNTYVGDQKFEAIKEGKELVNKCNIHWIDLGLSYQKDATKAGTWIYSFNGAEKTESDAVVDQEWKVGFLPVVKCPGSEFNCAFDALYQSLEDGVQPTNVFKHVSNVGVKYETEGVNNDVTSTVTEKNGNDAVVITSPKIGTMDIYGTLNVKSDSVRVEYYDALGEVQFFDTVGVSAVEVNDQKLQSTPGYDAQILYTMTWTPGNWDSTFVYPYGTTIDQNQDTVVYFKLHDKNNNPVADQDVEVAAKFDGAAYAVTSSSKTDKDGLIAITVNAPARAGELIFDITVAEVFKKTSSPINYVVNAEAAALAFDGDPTFDSANKNQVVVKFNNKLNTTDLDAEKLAKLFTVKDKDDNKLEIASIKVGVKEVTIVLKDETFIEGENYSVVVSTGDECTIGGITYVLTDVNGYAIAPANATKAFTVRY